MEINAKNNSNMLKISRVDSRCLTITLNRSYGFSQFLHCLRYQRWRINCWHFYWATLFAWSRKSKSISGSRGTDDSVLKIFEIFTLFMFLRSGNPLLIFLQSYHVLVTSKIQVNFRFSRYSEVLVIVSCRFLKFTHYLCFWGQGIFCWHSYWATMFRGPQKFRSPSGSRGFRGYPRIRSLTKML